MQRLVTVDTPEAGKDWFIQVPTVPEGIWWRLKTILFRFATSATVANRLPRVSVATALDGGGINGGIVPNTSYVVTSASAAQVAGAANDYVAQELGEFPAAAGNVGAFLFTLPQDIRVQPGHYIGTFTGGMDRTPVTGDQYAAIRLLVEEWVYEPAGERSPNIGDGSGRVDTINIGKLNDTLERMAQLLEAQTATP